MTGLQVFHLLPRKVLAARSSARQIAAAIEEAISSSPGVVELDFLGIEALTPSFVDELLGVIQGIVDRSGVALERIVVLHPPTRLSSKFEAVGRGRNLAIDEGQDGTWIISPSALADRSPP